MKVWLSGIHLFLIQLHYMENCLSDFFYIFLTQDYRYILIQCVKCPKRFAKPKDLEKHLRVHEKREERMDENSSEASVQVPKFNNLSVKKINNFKVMFFL